MNIELHEALVEPFREWLRSRGLELSPPIPAGDEEGSTFHVVTVPEERWRAVTAFEKSWREAQHDRPVE